MRRENKDNDINNDSKSNNNRRRNVNVKSSQNADKSNKSVSLVKDDENDIKEWDVSDDEEIQEFLSRDFDVVSESRRRLQERQRRARRESGIEDEDSNSDREKRYAKKNSHAKKSESERLQRMKLLFGALGVLVAVLVVAIIVTNPGGDKEKATDSSATDTTNVEIASNEETTDVIMQPEAEDSGIHTLITSYIDAAYIKADMEAVALVVDDTTNINVEKYNSRKKYIESYENIKCYKLSLC